MVCYIPILAEKKQGSVKASALLHHNFVMVHLGFRAMTSELAHLVIHHAECDLILRTRQEDDVS